MSIFESLENLNVSEECFDEIMGIVEELLEEGRREGESDADFKIRTADELSQKYKEKLGKAMARKDGLEKKAEEMCHLSSKALNKSNASSKKYPSTPPRNTKAGKDFEKAIRCHNAHGKANDAVSDNLKEIKSLNKKIDKVSAIKSNAQVQKKQENK